MWGCDGWNLDRGDGCKECCVEGCGDGMMAGEETGTMADMKIALMAEKKATKGRWLNGGDVGYIDGRWLRRWLGCWLSWLSHGG